MVGAGALGSAIAAGLALAGYREFAIIDPDRVERSNLPRLPWASESDLNAYKAQALARTLLQWDAPVSFRVQSITNQNVAELLSGYDVVFDGTDNWSARRALQQWSFATGRPWIYSSVLGVEGMTALLDARQGPCLFCLFSEELVQGPRCFEAGVLGPVALAVAGKALSLWEDYKSNGHENMGLYLIDGARGESRRIRWSQAHCPHRPWGGGAQ